MLGCHLTMGTEIRRAITTTVDTIAPGITPTTRHHGLTCQTLTASGKNVTKIQTVVGDTANAIRAQRYATTAGTDTLVNRHVTAVRITHTAVR